MPFAKDVTTRRTKSWSRRAIETSTACLTLNDDIVQTRSAAIPRNSSAAERLLDSHNYAHYREQAARRMAHREQAGSIGGRAEQTASGPSKYQFRSAR